MDGYMHMTNIIKILHARAIYEPTNSEFPECYYMLTSACGLGEIYWHEGV